MSDMGDHLLTVARWKVTGDLPPEEEVNAAVEFGVAFPIRERIGNARAFLGIHLGEEALRAGADRPLPISEVVDSLKWEDGTQSSTHRRAVDVPGNGIVVYAPVSDGRDRLGVLYSAVLTRDDYRDVGYVTVSVKWEAEPLPASVEVIRAKREAGTWLEDWRANDMTPP